MSQDVLLSTVDNRGVATVDARRMALPAHEGWTRRASAEGHEGTSAFREKRHPAWYRAQ